MPTATATHPESLKRDLLDTVEAAVVLDVTPGTLEVWRSTRRHNLPFVKVGRLVRYRRSDLVAWLESRTVGLAA